MASPLLMMRSAGWPVRSASRAADALSAGTVSTPCVDFRSKLTSAPTALEIAAVRPAKSRSGSGDCSVILALPLWAGP